MIQTLCCVIPAKAGTQGGQTRTVPLGPRFCGGDDMVPSQGADRGPYG
jgi:hypothetical protein